MANSNELAQGFVPEVIDPHIFPIGADSVNNVFRTLREKKHRLYDLVNTNHELGLKSRMWSENYSATSYLEDMENDLSNKIFAYRLGLGHALFYASLVRSQGVGAIPRLKEEFIDRYQDEKAERIDVPEEDSCSTVFVDTDFNYIQDLFRQTALFKILEPDTYEAVAKGVRKFSPTKTANGPAGDFLMAGFAQAYFLFKEGLSDMDNHETEHMLIH